MKFHPNITWTNHVSRKMKYYKLSKSGVKRALFHPERKEKGVVSGAVAVMKSYGNRKSQKEIWVMYKKEGENNINIITAWRYPGKSPVREKPPVPDDIMEELRTVEKQNS